MRRQSALAHWRAIDNLVLVVELTPASVPESVLLVENLPQLIWRVDSGKPRTRAGALGNAAVREVPARWRRFESRTKPVFEP